MVNKLYTVVNRFYIVIIELCTLINEFHIVVSNIYTMVNNYLPKKGVFLLIV